MDGGACVPSPRSATPRTPHSPSSPGLGSMSSPRASSSGAVRPVTARTWQASLAAPPPPAETAATGTGTGIGTRRVSVYNNDLYNNPDALAAQDAGRPASPHYQPTSARPGTPTPKSAERLQQQRIGTPSRLQAEGASSPSKRLQQVASLGKVVNVSCDATATVAAPPATTAEKQAEPANSKDAPKGASPAPADTGRPAPPPVKVAASKLAQQRAELQAARPTTAPSGLVPGSPTRRSKISLGSLAQQPPAAGSSIAAESPRVRQQVLQNFAGAVPAAGAAGGINSPRPLLFGEQGAASAAGNRPSTPSFQAIQSAAAAPNATSPTIKAVLSFGAARSAGLLQAADEAGAQAVRPVGAYPQPPMTAPPRAPAATLAASAQQQPQPGSLASYGITPAAFVAARTIRAGMVVGAHGEADSGPFVLTQAEMLAAASFQNNTELRRFLMTPGPADKPLHCKITRTKGGLLKGSMQYTLEVEQEGGQDGTFLLTARKHKGGPRGSTYLVSVDPQDISQHGPGFMGKLRSNFLGTEFVFYNAGDKRVKSGAEARCELGAALYQTNVLGTKGPRKMTVLIPKLEPSGKQPMALAPGVEHDALLGQYKSYNLSSCVVLRNKPPRWNQAINAYCLNFGGRVTQASVKNFQLVSVDNMDRTILQFGKVAPNTFTMDYSYPMTALQAFGICLSSFDSKLACE